VVVSQEQQGLLALLMLLVVPSYSPPRHPAVAVQMVAQTLLPCHAAHG
jgi:hypothetical protein